MDLLKNLQEIVNEYKILKEKNEKVLKYRREFYNEYYKKNRTQVLATQKKYHDRVKIERNAKQKIYRENNKEKINEKARLKRQIRNNPTQALSV